LFLVALENYRCKIKITCYKNTDYGTINTSSTLVDDFGSIDDDDGLICDYGLITESSTLSFTNLVVKRKEALDSTWLTIRDISLPNEDALNFVYFDKYTLSRHSYDYKFELMNNSTVVYSMTGNIDCDFDSIYISDASNEYIVSLNLNYDFDNNQEVSYQTLLQSKYPVRIQNGLSDYDSGFIEGLPLPLDSRGNPTPEGAYKYKQSYISFLKNGLFKYIKTYKGDAWYASINPGIKINQGEYEGAESVKFAWTQMGDTPLYGT